MERHQDSIQVACCIQKMKCCLSKFSFMMNSVNQVSLLLSSCHGCRVAAFSGFFPHKCWADSNHFSLRSFPTWDHPKSLYSQGSGIRTHHTNHYDWLIRNSDRHSGSKLHIFLLPYSQSSDHTVGGTVVPHPFTRSKIELKIVHLDPFIDIYIKK